jgi:hypothetical protein
MILDQHQAVKQQSLSNKFQNSKLRQISSSTPTYILILDSYKLKTKNVCNPLNQLIKILIEKSMNQSALNLNIQSTLAQAKLLTNLSNNETRARRDVLFASTLFGVFVGFLQNQGTT